MRLPSKEEQTSVTFDVNPFDMLVNLDMLKSTFVFPDEQEDESMETAGKVKRLPPGRGLGARKSLRLCF